MKAMMSAVMMPLRVYDFEISEDHYVLKVPKKGNLKELAPTVFTEDEEFNLMDEENKVTYVAALTKVLMASKKYPRLEDNQFFAPLYLVDQGDEVEVIGAIITANE